MTRADLTEKILDAKRSKGLTWKSICKDIGGSSPVLITAALLGQMRLDPVQAGKAAKIFGLGKEEAAMLMETPYRGSLPPGPPITAERRDEFDATAKPLLSRLDLLNDTNLALLD